MKVLLMVEREGRVVCAAWWEAAWEKALMAVVNGDPFSSVQFHSFNAVRRSGTPWKLVKADNAEVARAAIADPKSHPFQDDGRFDCAVCGEGPTNGLHIAARILASGGRS